LAEIKELDNLSGELGLELPQVPEDSVPNDDLPHGDLPNDDVPHDEESSETSGTQLGGAADERETVGDGEAAPEAAPQGS